VSWKITSLFGHLEIKIISSLKLFERRFELDIRKFSVSNRVIDAWNSLPALCVNSVAINCFKTHVSVALELETVM